MLVGSAVASAAGGFQPLAALCALGVAVFIQIGTNLANDAFDFHKGADTAERLGPARAVQQGWLSTREVAAGAALSLVLAVASGAWLVWLGGPWIAAFGLLCVALAVLYTGGPFPLAYHGLGDVFVMAFFGFGAVCGTAGIQLGRVPVQALFASVLVGALATAILVVNNLRDRHTDARANKRTLAVRFGAGFARGEYAALVALAYAAPVAAVAAGLAGPGWLLPLLSLPLALRRVRQIYRLDGAALNPLLGQTAQLELVAGALLALGCLL